MTSGVAPSRFVPSSPSFLRGPDSPPSITQINHNRVVLHEVFQANSALIWGSHGAAGPRCPVGRLFSLPAGAGGYADADRDGHANADSLTYGDGQSDGNSHRDQHANCHSDGDGHRNADSYRNHRHHSHDCANANDGCDHVRG
jgi:hypothetical protein